MAENEEQPQEELRPGTRWRRVRLFVWEDRDERPARREPTVLELSGRVDQTRILWSYTFGRLQDGEEFMPTTHLSARDTRAHVALLNAASREVSLLKAELRERQGNGAPQLPEAKTITVRGR